MYFGAGDPETNNLSLFLDLASTAVFYDFIKKAKNKSEDEIGR